MKIDALCQLAKDAGFTHAAPMDVHTIELKQEVRDMCAACSQYGKRWSCPPGCGDLQTLRQRVAEFPQGVLVQTVGTLEDEFDAEAMLETEAAHKEHLHQLQKLLVDAHPAHLIAGAGCCTICKTCTYPDAPCRFPDKQMVSMEACGMVVSEVCKANNVPYYYGPLTLAYTSCVLIK